MVKIEFKDGKEPIEINAETISAAVQNAVKSGANLSRADLIWADLSWADLRRANLGEADLRGADLSWANLSRADLSGADLIGVDLRRADLREADLRGADLDFSSWPLWCGSLNVKIDKRIFCQLLYHTLRAGKSVDDPEVKKLFEITELVNLANQFHRVDECGKIELKQRGGANGKD